MAYAHGAHRSARPWAYNDRPPQQILNEDTLDPRVDFFDVARVSQRHLFLRAAVPNFTMGATELGDVNAFSDAERDDHIPEPGIWSEDRRARPKSSCQRRPANRRLMLQRCHGLKAHGAGPVSGGPRVRRELSEASSRVWMEINNHHFTTFRSSPGSGRGSRLAYMPVTRIPCVLRLSPVPIQDMALSPGPSVDLPRRCDDRSNPSSGFRDCRR